ncbi:AraC family transcriptional regulator [Kribbella sp. NBC_00382]|uniref:AraC family transcriptional regulator n=1 Tax=Kribbella sp. NBC_00382 TaxID=2975967 RepID=UPI002E2166B6
MDLLADALAVSGVRGTLGARIEGAEPWAVAWQPVERAVIYAVTAGTAWLNVRGREPLELMPGDVVLLRNGAGHVLSSDPGALAPGCDHLVAERARETGDVLRFGTGEVRTHVTSASYENDPAISTQVLGSLPEVVHLPADSSGSCLDDTVRLIGREVAYPQLGAAIVLDRLVDILLVQLIRVWLAHHPEEARKSWLGVLDDPLLSAALTKLHGDPARPWTTASLATELAVSRATLSRRFLAGTGESPGAYLTNWRMDLAARRLRDSDDTLETIARAVGYMSVYAFSRAFSRARSTPPGRYRLTSRTAEPVGGAC